MAYRFNPPPNWPIEDKNWTPPPGWQPDPSWGPAPDGWSFWVEEGAEQPAAETAGTSADDQEGVDGSHSQVAQDRPEDAASDPDATHLASTGPQDSAGSTGHASDPAPHDDDATHVASTGETSGTAADTAAPGAVDSQQTQEYAGPDVAADLNSSAPYENDSSHEAGAAAAGAGAGAAAGAAASSSDLGGAQAPSYGAAGMSADDPGAGQGYGQQSAPSYGQDQSAGQGYGQGSASGYDQSAQGGYDPNAQAGWGQNSANGYGQGSASGYDPNAQGGYDQSAQGGYDPNAQAGWGQNSASGYSQGSPAAFGSPNDAQWSSTAGGGSEPPKKGLVARFWWVGCIVLFLIGALLVGLIAVFALFGGGGSGEDPTSGPTTEETTEEPTEDPTSEEPTEDPTTEEPTENPTTEEPTEESTEGGNSSGGGKVSEDAESIEVSASEGKGTIKIDQKWTDPSDLKVDYGEIGKSSKAGGQYLVVTAELTVEEGEMAMNPYNFTITTPYGGAVDHATESYQLTDSGVEHTDLRKGDTHTMVMIFEVEKAGGLELNYSTYTNDYQLPVPTK